MAKRRINRWRAALAAVAVVALVGAAFTVHSVHRRARNREIYALLLRVCGDDRAAHEAALEECSGLDSAADIRYMARLLADGSIEARHVVPALASIGEPAFEPVVRAVSYPPDDCPYFFWMPRTLIIKREAHLDQIRCEKTAALEHAAHFFRAVGRTSQPFLLSCLSRPDRDTQRMAVQMLYRMIEPEGEEDVIPLISVKPVIPLLADADEDTVSAASQLLASRPEEIGSDVIMQMLGHSSTFVPGDALRALITAGKNGALETLMTPEIRARITADSSNPRLPSAMAILARLSDAESAEILAMHLQGADAQLAFPAAGALHFRGDARGREWLLKSYVAESDLHSRRRKLSALAARPDSEIVDILLASFDETDGFNRPMDIAAWTLERGNAAPADVARLRAAFAERLFGPDEAMRRAVMKCSGFMRPETLRDALGDDIFDEVWRLWKEDMKSPDPEARKTAWSYLDNGRPPDLDQLLWDMLAVEKDPLLMENLHNSLFELTKRRIRARYDRENGYE